ncbi:hypothetical protein PybrP1_002279 [[Pythium] brassicae (nom. inval.)]|nr:hypothetical protein PybrP1_002279 [[Pythium] brassicae (nom. inval.)]
MGRVASKRKLKQCDPFFKGKREGGKKAKEYDLAPSKSKRAKKRQRKQVDDAHIEQFVTRISEVSTTSGSAKKDKSKLNVGSIREGESMRAFQKRISTEVKRVIYDETKKTRRSTEKRKEFLEKKKEKVKNRKMTDQERYEQEFQTSGSTKKDYFDGAEKVRFGERVDAPPVMPKLKGIFKKRAEQLQKQKSQGKPPQSQPSRAGGKRAAAGAGAAGNTRPAKKARR